MSDSDTSVDAIVTRLLKAGPASPSLLPDSLREVFDDEDEDGCPISVSKSWLQSVSPRASTRDVITDRVRKAEDGEAGESAQGANEGVVEHPFDFDKMRVLAQYNTHHATCLEAKVSATVGLGWVSPKVSEALDPLCEGITSFDDLLERVMGDLEELGNGAIEISRDSAGKVNGLFYADPAQIHVVLTNKDDRQEYHFEMEGEWGSPLKFAQFGKLDETQGRGIEVKTELLWLSDPARGSLYYGRPTWIPAIPKMELEQAVTQHNYDFFWNRCVPELLLAITGGQVSKATWTDIETRLSAHAGMKRQRKTMAINLPAENLELQVHPLGGEISGETEGFAAFAEALAVIVVSAHRVPPLLAGIQIPGKLGAANEMSNSIMAFQALVIAPRQRMVCKLFARTLGDPELSGGLEVTADDFLGKNDPAAEAEPDALEQEMGVPPQKPADRKGNGLVTITEVLDLGKMETASKMRMSLAEAKARGRDMNAGPAERGSDVAAGRGTGTAAGGAA